MKWPRTVYDSATSKAKNFTFEVLLHRCSSAVVNNHKCGLHHVTFVKFGICLKCVICNILRECIYYLSTVKPRYLTPC